MLDQNSNTSLYNHMEQCEWAIMEEIPELKALIKNFFYIIWEIRIKIDIIL